MPMAKGIRVGLLPPSHPIYSIGWQLLKPIKLRGSTPTSPADANETAPAPEPEPQREPGAGGDGGSGGAPCR
jgi:hypothetical protein